MVDWNETSSDGTVAVREKQEVHRAVQMTTMHNYARNTTLWRTAVHVRVVHFRYAKQVSAAVTARMSSAQVHLSLAMQHTIAVGVVAARLASRENTLLS